MLDLRTQPGILIFRRLELFVRVNQSSVRQVTFSLEITDLLRSSRTLSFCRTPQLAQEILQRFRLRYTVRQIVRDIEEVQQQLSSRAGGHGGS